MAPKSLVGKTAPTITLPNWDGESFTFTPGTSDRPTAVFFYPKSGTYGCTKEACQFRDALTSNEVYKNANIQVIGISPDPVAKQKEFVEKQGLTYPVLSDVNGEARKAYGIGKGMFGLTESGRVTFVIDREGIVKDCVDTTMNFSAHAKFVTKWLKDSQAAPTATEGEAPSSTTDAPAPEQLAEPVAPVAEQD